MKKIALLSVMAVLCLLFVTLPLKTFSQEFLPKEKSDSCYLQGGQQVPDITLYDIRGTQDFIRLHSINAKLTILDFWSIYCTPCIKAFPKLDSLTKQYPRDLSILAVNANGNSASAKKSDSVLQLFENIWKRKIGIPTVYIGPATTSLFFYMISVPHYIWLNEKKQIIAITGQDAVTEENIKNLLLGKTILLQIKPPDTNKKGKQVAQQRPVSLTR